MTQIIASAQKNMNVEELKTLARQAGPCVTIQIPSYQPGAGGGSRQAYLRQVTHTAADGLRNLAQSAAAEETTAALKDLISNLPLDHGGPAIALFCAPGFAASFEIPGASGASSSEQVTVADHFHLLPYLAIAQAPSDFFILGLSRKHLRFIRYVNGRCTELPLPASVPASLEAACGFDKPEHNLENRSSAGPSVGGMGGVHFGVSSDRDADGEYMRHFFEAVDKGLKDTLGTASLFLAGVHEEIALYRKTAKYPHIFEAECNGNPERSSLDQLARHAGAGAVGEYRATCERALRSLTTAREKIVEQPLLIQKTASSGRVRQIFVGENTGLPGGAQNLGALREDARNAAVVEGLRTGAEVFSFPGVEIPGIGSIAAIMRY